MKRRTLLQRVRELNPDIGGHELYARILCGEIQVNGVTVRSPREPVHVDAVIEHRPPKRFVSRGGQKLDGVLARWNVRVEGLSFIDAGASTGGFTDCLLRRGAQAVIAVERGFNQLDFRLRQDPRVTTLEKTNIMSLAREDLPFAVDAAVADLSLRSLRSAASHILSLLPEGWLIALVKPQYERTGEPGFDGEGVVRDREETVKILRTLLRALEDEGLAVIRGAPSAIRGVKGNREFFFEVRRNPESVSGVGNEGKPVLALEELVAEAFSG
jgi:23S rRNA (cytidine1920-2'-O)/16S rRNA (cytidine1409-2'-O)-methyltransferase